ncbi:MAG: cbb3-type cytochrome oxidase subunit 3 [Pseudobdellovibrionaceae bacterium]
MKQEALKYFTETHLTAIGLLIFFMFFVSVLFWVYRKSSTELYTELEQLPLKGE